jgi:uncharacterized protein YkwD
LLAACSPAPALPSPTAVAHTRSPATTSPSLTGESATPGADACAAILCGLFPPDPGAPAATQEAFLRRRVLLPIAENILELANAERRALGLEALAPSSELTDLAFARSEDMVVRGYFGHEDPGDGHLLAQGLLVSASYGGRLGENLFSYGGSLNDLAPNAMAAWMSSTAEGSLVLDSAFRLTGVGIMGDGSSWMVTQLFAEIGPEPRCACEQP